MSDIQAPPDAMLRAFEPIYREFLTRLGAVRRDAPDIQFTSWWRNDAFNRSVGGAFDSQHLAGFAVDLVASRPDVVQQLARQVGLIPVVEMDHVHIQLFPAGLLARIGFFGPTV